MSELNLIRDLTGFAISLARIADAFYDANHQPKPDAVYRNLPAFSSLNWKPVSDTLGDPERVNCIVVKDAGDWLQSHDVAETAHYTSGNSALICALRLKDHRIKVLRIGHAFNQIRGAADHDRLNSALALQPEAERKNMAMKFLSLHNAGAKTPHEYGQVEILPCVPVLPNGILGIEFVSGHNVYKEEPLCSGASGSIQPRLKLDTEIGFSKESAEKRLASFAKKGLRVSADWNDGEILYGPPISYIPLPT